MPTLIPHPTRIQAAGNKPKLIDEYIGRVNSKTSAASVAHMRSPQGWLEPGQTPEFDEFTIVLKGMLRVHHKGGSLDVAARTSRRYPRRGVGALLHAAGRRGGIHCGMPASVFDGNCAQGCVSLAPPGCLWLTVTCPIHII